MKLSEFPGAKKYTNFEVKGLSFDSRKCGPGDVFFAIRGTNHDGHQHLAEVAKKNPVALVVEDSNLVPNSFSGPVIKVRNSRHALDMWAAQFFGKPSDRLFCVGVTGTNGKTTSVYLLESIFNAGGRQTGVMGTIDHHLGTRVWDTPLTTPDPVTLQSRLSEFIKYGATVAAFEVSSIALDQHRVSSIPFNAALFTNFTRDHLDYHRSMEKYFAAKNRLFGELLPKSSKPNVFAVLNGDDPQVRKTSVKNVRAVWFGMQNADYAFRVTEQSMRGSRFFVTTPLGVCECFIATPGLHNVYNAVGATAIALESGLGFTAVQTALAGFTGAPGRLESVPNERGLYVFVDYAHTDDALRSVLTSLRQLMVSTKSKGKLWTVFGCGGDRDRGKRPLMAQAAVENSDHVVITSDNPRTEDPEEIIRECLQGVPGRSVFSEVDRRRGIARALQTAREGDVILIAGKGHEQYQVIGTKKTPFHDVAVTKELLK